MLPFIIHLQNAQGTSDIAWKQTQLSLCRGGFGLRYLVRHSSAAYIASVCNSIDVSPLNHHLADAINITV